MKFSVAFLFFIVINSQSVFSQMGIGVNASGGLSNQAHREYQTLHGAGFSIMGRISPWWEVGYGFDKLYCTGIKEDILKEMNSRKHFLFSDFNLVKQKILIGISMGHMKTSYWNYPIHSGSTEILPTYRSAWPNWFGELHAGCYIIKGLSLKLSYTYTFRHSYDKHLANDYIAATIGYRYIFEFDHSSEKPSQNKTQ